VLLIRRIKARIDRIGVPARVAPARGNRSIFGGEI
jgi:hypothetical protein